MNRPSTRLIYRSAAIAALIVLLLALVGCNTPINPGADPVVVNSQRSQRAAFEAVNTFLEIEHKHRDLVREQWPQVHQYAEMLRKEFPKQDKEVSAAIAAYKESRTTENAERISTALETIQTSARVASKFDAEIRAATGGP